jgi:type II secretory pathway component PulF
MESSVNKKSTNSEGYITFDGYKIRALDKVHFFQHLALMLDAGVNIIRALNALSSVDGERVIPRSDLAREQEDKLRLQDLFRLQKGSSASNPIEPKAPKHVRRRNIAQLALILSRNLARGFSLSESMARLPDVFSEYQVRTVRVGEKSGALVKTLFCLADHEEERRQAVLEMKKALVYPLFVATLSFLFFISVPRLFFGFMVTDGLITSGAAYYMIRGSQFLTHPATVVTIALVIIAGVFWLRDKQRKEKATRIFWKVASIIPAISRYRQANRARHLVLTLHMLIRTGIPIQEGVRLAIDSCGDFELSDMKQPVLDRLKAGAELHQTLDFLPLVTVNFIKMGEESGQLEKALKTAEGLLRDELSHTRSVALTLLEPIMMISVGVMVGLLAVSVLSAVSSMIAF